MKITSSFLPPFVGQPSLQSAEATQQPVREPRQQSSDGSDEAVRLVVGEVETALERQRSRRGVIDLRSLQENPVPFKHFLALSSYQQVESGSEFGDGLARLDIFV